MKFIKLFIFVLTKQNRAGDKAVTRIKDMIDSSISRREKKQTSEIQKGPKLQKNQKFPLLFDSNWPKKSSKMSEDAALLNGLPSIRAE